SPSFSPSFSPSASPSAIALPSHWHHTSWIPIFLDNKLAHFSMARDELSRHSASKGKTKGKTPSEVDIDISFRSVSDIIAYIPNALMNGLIRPFPTFAFTHSHNGLGTFTRRVAGLEMIIVYIGLAGLLWSIWTLKNRVSLILLVVACLVSVLVYSLIYCNIGTLHRMRYGFLLTLTGIGLAQLFEMFFVRFTVNNHAPVPPVR
ncbi:MAG: hypothetical protein KAG53_11715, partial [Endozoicomonadaceae bacterium]|nr:hypothetical protein [Endozoicomonadaceae bacterium]